MFLRLQRFATHVQPCNQTKCLFEELIQAYSNYLDCWNEKISAVSQGSWAMGKIQCW